MTRRGSSGLVNAVEPLLLKHSGVWVGEGIGDEDRRAANDRDGVRVPVESPRYRLRRVYLSAAERRGYYYGFANSALWPLCHRTAVEPMFYAGRLPHLRARQQAVCRSRVGQAVSRAPVVLVQDYHFALAPALIRAQLPLSRISTFWHIPWPRPETSTSARGAAPCSRGCSGAQRLGCRRPRTE